MAGDSDGGFLQVLDRHPSLCSNIGDEAASALSAGVASRLPEKNSSGMGLVIVSTSKAVETVIFRRQSISLYNGDCPTNT